MDYKFIFLALCASFCAPAFCTYNEEILQRIRNEISPEFDIAPRASTRETDNPCIGEDGEIHAGEFFEYPGECGLYYQCDAAGNAIVRNCADGLAFNPAIERCDFENNVPGCQNFEPDSLEALCRNPDGSPNDYFVFDPATCEYYYCVNGIPQPYPCPPGLEFNPVTNSCDWPSGEECVPEPGKKPEYTPGSDVPTSQEENTTPATTSEEETTPSFDVEDKTTPSTDVEDKTTPSTGVEDKTTPLTDVEDNTTPLTDVEDKTTPLTDVEDKTTPSTDVEGKTTPLNDVEDNTTPLTDVEGKTTPSTDSEDKTTPSTDLEGNTTPSTDVEDDTTPSTDVEDDTTPLTDVEGKTTPSTDSEDITTPSSNLEDNTTSSNIVEDKTTSKPLIPDSDPVEGDSFVGFVIDDTGSMAYEIEAVRVWLTNCVGGNYTDCAVAPTGGWILSTFNDPTIGEVVGPTTDLTVITSAIDGLYAHGGGDCPERAFSGLLTAISAVEEVNSDCKIFFFSDALASDEGYYDQVKEQFMKKGCRYIPMLTGCCAPCQDPCLSVDPEYCINQVVDTTSKSLSLKRSAGMNHEELYYDLASASGGKIYLTDKPTSADDFLEFLEDEVTLGFCPTDEIAGPPPLGYENERDCNSTNSCWDRSQGKCFCQSSTEPCPNYPITTTPKPTTPPPIPDCSPDTVHSFDADPKNCFKYYECSHGQQWHRDCAAGTVFDEDLSVCNHPEQVKPPCGTAGV